MYKKMLWKDIKNLNLRAVDDVRWETHDAFFRLMHFEEWTVPGEIYSKRDVYILRRLGRYPGAVEVEEMVTGRAIKDAIPYRWQPLDDNTVEICFKEASS